jgi:hypothetical protein
MKLKFNVTGTVEVPDDVVMHEDILNQLYALEMNDKMYMLQICLVAESPDGEYEIVHQYDEMAENNFKNLRYENAEFEQIV